MDDALYKKGYVIPYVICLHPHQAQEALLEIHEGLCGGHLVARSLALKVGRQCYFWPIILKDAKGLVRKCGKCQRFANKPHIPAKQMFPISNPWSFSQWGIDLVGSFYKGKGHNKYVMMVID